MFYRINFPLEVFLIYKDNFKKLMQHFIANFFYKSHFLMTLGIPHFLFKILV